MVIEEIIYRLLKGQATVEEQQEVQQWLAEGEENMRMYEEICRKYYRLHYAAQWDDIQEETALQKVKETIRQKERFKKWGYRLSGVAAVFLICMSGILLWKSKPITPEVKTVEHVHSDEKKAMLTLADGRKVELTAENKMDVDLGFARAVKDSLAGMVYQFKDTAAIPNEFHTLSVPRAGEYIMVLSDGTRVWLNAETELRYPVAFAADKREVYVSGEAYFEVVKDAGRPFVVHTSHTQTIVLGTSFNVMAYDDVRHTEITLLTGMVEVDAGGKSCRILPGQQVAVNNRSLQIESREVNPSLYTSWKDGLFDFDHMRLEDLCRQLSRWYDVDFFFVNPSAADKCFTGAVKRNNSLRFMLDFVEKTSEVRFEVNGKTVSVYNQ